MSYRLTILIFIAVSLFGCTTCNIRDDAYKMDCLDKFNRSVFNFNYNTLDSYLARPAATFWIRYVPPSFRNGLSNFFTNLEEPAIVVNYFVKGNIYKSMLHFNRFFLNTIFGMWGLVDIAYVINPKLAKEEPRRFGSTLSNYGIGYGPYIQLPIYGSFTPREDLGDLVDNFYPILSYLNWWMLIGKWALKNLEIRAQMIGLDNILKNSQDPYAVVRIAYFQRHTFLTNEALLTTQKNIILNNILVQDELNKIDS